MEQLSGNAPSQQNTQCNPTNCPTELITPDNEFKHSNDHGSPKSSTVTKKTVASAQHVTTPSESPINNEVTLTTRPTFLIIKEASTPK